MDVLCTLVVIATIIGGIVYLVRRGNGAPPSTQQSAASASLGPRAHDGLPVGIVSMLERFGRHSMEMPDEPGDDPTEIYRDIVVPLYTLAQADPDRFAAAVRDRVLPIGGWAVLGASRMMWEALTQDQQPPARAQLLDAALEFMRDRGVPYLYVKGYELTRWHATKGQTEPWLRGRPKPSVEEAPITDLRDGELRRIVQIFPAADSNVIFVRRHPEGGYVSVIDARWSDDHPQRVQREDKRTATLNDLYWEIGCGLQTPSYWYHPEMAPYFPLPRPRLD